MVRHGIAAVAFAGLLALTCIDCVAEEVKPVENFTVQRVGEGDPFELAKARGRWVALHFLLKTECPICIRHTHAYSVGADEVAGVVHVFLKPDTDEEIKTWIGGYDKRTAQAAMPSIYRDPDAALAKRLGVPDGYKFHGQTVHYPAFVLIDPQGKEAFRHVGKNNSDRFGFVQFSEKMAELTSGGAAHLSLSKQQVALGGYDPVSYFTAEAPVKGQQTIASRYQGATYRFATADNRHMFAANPAKYVPAYGGWCAAAMVKGEKVAADPKNHKVTAGRLFLFNKDVPQDALSAWDKADGEAIGKADAAWKGIVTSQVP